VDDEAEWEGLMGGAMKSPAHTERGEQPLIAGAPELPTVAALADAARNAGLEIAPDVKLVAVQHMVRTNLTLFQELIGLGLNPRNVYAIGKGYSTSPACITALREVEIQVSPDLVPPAPGRYEEARERELEGFWKARGREEWLRSQQKLIVCDVGGRLLSLVQDECTRLGSGSDAVGIELTTSGIRRLESQKPCIPIIDVAEAAAKSVHESPLVANAILDRIDLRAPGHWPHVRAGVIGLGHIGKAVIGALESRGIEVVAATVNSVEAAGGRWRQVPMGQLLEEADIVFGCSGVDLFSRGFPYRHKPGLVLVSCSSEDVEFHSLLTQSDQAAGGTWPAPDVTISGPSGLITILHGGFPFNFDASGISLPEQMVQTTTALMLCAILTASHVLSSRPAWDPGKFIQVPSLLQAAVLDQWRRSPAADESVRNSLGGIADAEYLGKRSKGYPLPDQDAFARVAQLMRSQTPGEGVGEISMSRKEGN
jgi:hypothetical protein